MRGGPGDAPPLETVGRPAIVVVRIAIPRSTYTAPALQKVFVGSMLGTARAAADVHLRHPVSVGDVLEIWQPGDPEYDRHAALPR